MGYPGVQYIDVACYADDYAGLIAEVLQSDEFIEGEDYTGQDNDNFKVLRDTADFHYENGSAFMVLRIKVGADARLLGLANLDIWKVVPVKDEHGEQFRPKGVYDLPPPKQAILDGFTDFNPVGFMGRVIY